MDDDKLPFVGDVVGKILRETDQPVSVIGDIDPADLASCVCWQCDKLASKSVPLEKCGLCKRAYYCNSTCRGTHWPTHKLFCVPISSQETLSEADGYTQFVETRKDKEVYVLECDHCNAKMFCNNTNSGCPKAMAWQAICTGTGHPALLDLCATVHQF